MQESVRSIQFLRFIAASLVVLSHSVLAADHYFAGSIPPSTIYLTNFGASGVHIFFVISGFVMVYTSFRKNSEFSSEVFLTRRFIRIFPIFWIYAAMYMLAHQTVLQTYDLSVQDIFKSLLLLPGHSSSIIGPGWTLSFEVYFYICFAIFMSSGPLRGLILMTLFFVASILIGSRVHSENAAFHVATDTLLIEFLAGAWIGYFFVTGNKLSNLWSNVLLALAVSGFVVGLAYGYHQLPSILMWGVPSALLISGFVFKERAAHLPGLVQRFSFLGDSSYSLYLVQILLIDLFLTGFVAAFGNPGSGYLVICLALTLSCILVALLLYELVEHRVVSGLQAWVRDYFSARMAKRAI